MKKRILAALVAVAMVFSVCTLVSAEAATPIIAENYDGETVGFMAFTDGTVVADPIDPSNKVLSVTDAGWGSHKSDYWTIDGLSADKVYTLKFRSLGDIGMMCVTRDSGAIFSAEFQAWGSTMAAMQSQDWEWTIVKLTGKERYAFGLQVQAAGPFFGCTAFFDDIEIYEGDLVDDLTAALPTPEPEPTEAPTAAPTEAPTAAVDVTPAVTVDPTATAAVTTAPTASVEPTTPVTPPPVKKVKISFKKKTYKVKKGKKVTVKITLKNAKSAKFSVDKKGKKLVKLSKKKAKSVVVKGKKKGTAKITATAKGKKATCKVKVK